MVQKWSESEQIVFVFLVTASQYFSREESLVAIVKIYNCWRGRARRNNTHHSTVHYIANISSEEEENTDGEMILFH